MVGGGTAGHVLPLTALVSELRADNEVIVVTDRSRVARSITSDLNDETHRLLSGKFRRYHGRSWIQRLSDVSTLLLNLRDVLFLGIGLLQAVWLMLRRRPKVVFINGGAIGVPVATTARFLRVPYLIHESDTQTGLANRLIGGGAKRILLGLGGGTKLAGSVVTGIPVRQNFASARKLSREDAKSSLGLDINLPLVLITGGSQGAAIINKAAVSVAPELAELAQVVHLCGSNHIENLSQVVNLPKNAYRLIGFAGEEMAHYYAAADLVVTRAGATTLADLAFFGKPAILIPNPMLVGGHQLANAQLFADAGAAELLDEAVLSTDPKRLVAAVRSVLESERLRRQLSQNISAFARPDATEQIAKHILAVGRGEAGGAGHEAT